MNRGRGRKKRVETALKAAAAAAKIDLPHVFYRGLVSSVAEHEALQNAIMKMLMMTTGNVKKWQPAKTRGKNISGERAHVLNFIK